LLVLHTPSAQPNRGCLMV